MNTLISTIAVVTFALFVRLGTEPQRAKPKIVDVPAFTVIGISARTSNAKEMSGHGVIDKQWQRLMKENLLSKIPDRADANTIAIYTDYESNATGAYTFILGAKVTSAENIPAGMIAVNVPRGKYARFTSDRGPAAKVVPETWTRVWSATKSVLGGERAYKVDFELYGPRAADPENAPVDIYVGVNK